MSSSGRDDDAVIAIELDDSQEQQQAVPFMPAPPPSLPPPTTQQVHVQYVNSPAPQRQYHLRQRSTAHEPVHAPASRDAAASALANGTSPNAIPSPRRAHSPLRTFSYSAETTWWDKLLWPLKRVGRFIVPAPSASYGRDHNVGWKRPPTRSQWVEDDPMSSAHTTNYALGSTQRPLRMSSAARRACTWVIVGACFLVLAFTAIIGVDILASNRDLHSTQTARLLKVFNGENREGRLQSVVKVKSSGVHVYNVLEPQHGVETSDDVKALFRKLRARGGKALTFSDEQLRDGYVTYEHEQPLDADADLLKVNATLDSIEALIVRNAYAPIDDGNGGLSSTSKPLQACESYVQYGIEYNAFVLFAEVDGQTPDVFYNAAIDESSDEAFDEPQPVPCRVHRALADTHDEKRKALVQVERVPRYVTLLYTTRDGKRRRRKLVEPASVACAMHALRLAGTPFDGA